MTKDHITLDELNELKERYKNEYTEETANNNGYLAECSLQKLEAVRFIISIIKNS